MLATEDGLGHAESAHSVKASSELAEAGVASLSGACVGIVLKSVYS